MEKYCINCIHKELAADEKTGKEYYRCSLDMELRINKRMYCEEFCTTKKANDYVPTIQR